MTQATNGRRARGVDMTQATTKCRDCDAPAVAMGVRETDPMPNVVDPASNPAAPVCVRHAHPAVVARLATA